MRCRNSDLWFGNVLIKPRFFFLSLYSFNPQTRGSFWKNVHTRNNNMTVVDKASRFGHHKPMDSGGSSATLRPARKMKQKAHLHATKRCREDHDPKREREREREWKRKTKQVCFSLTYRPYGPSSICNNVDTYMFTLGAREWPLLWCDSWHLSLYLVWWDPFLFLLSVIGLYERRIIPTPGELLHRLVVQVVYSATGNIRLFVFIFTIV